VSARNPVKFEQDKKQENNLFQNKNKIVERDYE
jgi:hypothetical protein